MSPLFSLIPHCNKYNTDESFMEQMKSQFLRKDAPKQPNKLKFNQKMIICAFILTNNNKIMALIKKENQENNYIRIKSHNNSQKNSLPYCNGSKNILIFVVLLIYSSISLNLHSHNSASNKVRNSAYPPSYHAWIAHINLSC